MQLRINSMPAKNFAGDEYTWTVVTDQLGTITITESFAQRILESQKGAIASGFRLRDGRKSKVNLKIAY